MQEQRLRRPLGRIRITNLKERGCAAIQTFLRGSVVDVPCNEPSGLASADCRAVLYRMDRDTDLRMVEAA